MGTAVVRYLHTDPDNTQRPCWGVLRDGAVHHLDVAAGHHRELLHLWFNHRQMLTSAISETGTPLADLQLLSPLGGDIQLYCQGLNYASHRAESGINAEDAGENLLFLKASSSLCGPNDAIVRPRDCVLLDYEVELGLVLRRAIDRPTQVTDANLGDYVGGLVLCNDVSARDLMFGAPMLQWFRGKSQRTFCPAGPVLFLLEDGDLAQIYSLQLKLWLNGELRQQAVTDQLIHKPPQTLTEISGFANLAAGDCILTGTPGGVLAGHSLKAALAILLNLTNDTRRRQKFVSAQLAQADFLKPGDILELEIVSLDGSIHLGRQRNEIIDAHQ